MIIRSYRVCFELERRLHRIDRWRLPVPHGIPLRGVAYALSILAAMLVLGSFPLVGALVGTLHPVLRYIVLPVGLAYLMVQATVDGRPAHRAGLSWARHALAPKRLVAFRPAAAPGPVRLRDIPVAPDEYGANMRRGVVEGPARVTLRYPAKARQRGKRLSLSRLPGGPLWRGPVITVPHGHRVVVQ